MVGLSRPLSESRQKDLSPRSLFLERSGCEINLSVLSFIYVPEAINDSRKETRADETNYFNISIPVPKLSRHSKRSELNALNSHNILNDPKFQIYPTCPACPARPVGPEDRTGVKFEDYLTGVARVDGTGMKFSLGTSGADFAGTLSTIQTILTLITYYIVIQSLEPSGPGILEPIFNALSILKINA